MNTQLLQALIFSLWAILMGRLFQRAYRLQVAVAMKKRKVPQKPDRDEPMAVRVNSLP
jgi:hypothetical protein